MSINTTKEDLSATDKLLESCDEELEKQSDLLGKLDFYYEQFVSWADEFDDATLEQKNYLSADKRDSSRQGLQYRNTA